MKDIDYSSDSEPEEVAFKQGRDEANQALQAIASELKLLKENVKRKRALLHERNSLQKQAKLKRIEALESRKLPAEFLNEVSKLQADQKNLEVRTVSTSSPTISNTNQNQVSNDLLESEENDTEPDLKQSEDYISLHGTTKFKVAVLTKELKTPKSISTTAADFRKNMLNRKSVPRESVKEMLSRQEKQRVNGNLTFK